MPQSVPLANQENTHDAGNFSSDQGSVTGYTVTGNTNINRNAPAKPAISGVQGGSSRRRTRRNRKRGGGYGFNPNGKPGFGVMPIKSYKGCGVPKDPNLNVATQYVGSPPPQRGGSKSACGGCGGTPYYGYTKAIPGLNNYAPVTAECHTQCGGKRRRRRRKRRTRKRRRTRRHKRRRRTKRGGYAQFGGNIPSTPGYATPNGGNWQTANPPTYARNDACGTGNCVDNYNHFTGKGGPSPVLDADVIPSPPVVQIKTPNNTAQCGGRKRKTRRRRRRRKTRRRKRRRTRRHKKRR